jgi:sialic acid synthase SpsE
MSIDKEPEYSQIVKIGKDWTSDGGKTYFIADIAANHDGDLSRAKDLIYLAKEAGADCAKFQHFLAKDIVSDFGFKNMGDQQSHQSGWKDSVYNIYEKYQTSRDWTESLIETSAKAGIDFMTTPYDKEAIDLFSDSMPAYKIGSGDITWIASVERMASKGKPIMLATGASSMADVERAVNATLRINPDIVLMQCNTNYTAKTENFCFINLNVLKSYAKRWPGMPLGLSDHTLGHATVLGAIALGATVVEKHFTDDNERVGPDHHFAMNPKTWRLMVERSRELELAMGDGVKRVEENEGDTVVIQRRSIRVKRDLPSGHILTEDDLEALRPCPIDSLEPYQMNEVLDKTIQRKIPKGDHLKWIDLK